MPRIVHGKIVPDDAEVDRVLGLPPSTSAQPVSSAFPSSSPLGSQLGGAPGHIALLLLLCILFGGSSIGFLLRYGLVGVTVYAVLMTANTPRSGAGGGAGGRSSGDSGGSRGWNVRGVRDLPKPPAGA